MSTNPDAQQRAVSAAFIGLADSLVDEYDVADTLDTLMTACVELFLCEATGIVLADPAGALHVMASSTEQARLLELLELQHSEGPCWDCYRSGTAVSADDSADAAVRWPRFSPAARAAGYVSVHALPMRLRSRTIGAVNLFFTERVQMDPERAALAQALADMATIAILVHRVVDDSTVLAAQLQSALTHRLAIEQAKGILAERGQVDMATAFAALRTYCRSHRVSIADTADRLVSGQLAPGVILRRPRL